MEKLLSSFLAKPYQLLLLSLALVGMVVLTSACSSNTTKTEDAVEEMKEDVTQAKDDVMQMFEKEKSEFQEFMEDTKEEIEYDLEQAKNEMQNASASAKAEYEDQIKNLQGKLDGLETKMMDLKNASAEKWSEMKKDLAEWKTSMQESLSSDS